MILIADSGSTKTDWRLIDDEKKVHPFRTGGLNPYFLNSAQITEVIQHELILTADRKLVTEIYFYGAGCSGETSCKSVGDGLHRLFTNASIAVQHDLIAACRSLCGREAGIAAILGTGSNSCQYDGEKITDQVPSLGFILGDEGSGTHIGKKLLQSIFYNELPENLAGKFFERYKLSREDVLESVYKKQFPNRFLASFTRFMFQHIKEKSIYTIVYDSFSEFICRQIMQYPGYKEVKMHCTGSVGYFFGDILRKAATEKGIRVGSITESPIAGLTLYHLGEL